MKKKLIELLGKITLNDLNPEQRAKANELLVMLKGEPRARKKRARGTVTTKSVTANIAVAEPEESFT